LLPGEGIGPEVRAATQRVLDASGVKIKWEILAARAENRQKDDRRGSVLNTAAIESVRAESRGAEGPDGEGYRGWGAQR